MKILVLHIFFFIISINIYPQENNPQSDKFEIDEINILYTSTKTFDEDKIKDIIQTGKTKYFNSGEFIIDIARIEKFYFDNGFFDAVVDTSVIIDYDKKEISVTFRITENQFYRINTVEYIGLENIGGELRNLLFNLPNNPVKKNMRFISENVNEEIKRIINLLNNNGYADAYYEPPEIIKYKSPNKDLSNIVDIKFSFKTGRQYEFGKTKIFLKKNKYGIPRKDILNYLVYKEKSIFNKEKLIESEIKIGKIPIIENGRIFVDYLDTLNGIINFKIDASLKNKYELKPELFGYEITNRFYAGAGLSFSDLYFFGGGRTMLTGIKGLVHSLDVNAVEFNSSLFQPNVFQNSSISGNWKLNVSLSSIEMFRISSIKNTFGFSYELPKFTYINNLFLDWRMNNERFYFKEGMIADIDDTSIYIPENSYSNVITSAISLSAIHNNTNNFQFPSNGFFQAFQIEESGLVGSLLGKLFNTSYVSYVKLSMTNKFYFNLSDKTNSSSVLATKFLIGTIFEYGDSKLKISGVSEDLNLGIVPLEARFIAGGSTSVRGWRAMKLGTFPEPENGGNFILEGSFEHRLRPFLKSKSIIKDIGFVYFLDYGNLWDKPGSFRISDIALAIGFGLRYYTLIGPIRLDFGFKLYDYAPGTDIKNWLFENNLSNIFKKQFEFQFGIGHTF